MANTLVEEEIEKVTDAFFNFTETNSLNEKDFSGGYIYKYFIKIKAKNFLNLFGAKWQDKLKEVSLYPQRIDKDKKQLLDGYQNEIADWFQQSKKAILKRDYLKAIDKSLIPLSLLSEIANEIAHIKKERSLVLISDFNATIAKEINDQPVPFIYERLGERYKNYFIDEFQDTSELQWTNIIPLADHNLNTQQIIGEPVANITLVGDAKQSIYRFRGGKAEQFIDLCNLSPAFQIEQKVIDLPFNYRSSTDVIEFNNSFFEFVATRFNNETYRGLFEKSKQGPKKDFRGYVNINFLEAKNKEEELEMHPEKVLDIIQDLDTQGVLRSDICILTRTRKESFAVANYLNEQGVSIISSESLLVSNSPEVQFITSLFAYSLNPNDKNVKWELLNYLVEKLNIPNAHNLFLKNLEKQPEDFFTWLQEYDIYFDISKLQSLSLYESAEYIIRSFQLIKTSDAYLQFFLDFIFDALNNTTHGIAEFLQLWEQKSGKLSILAPKSDHAVQIMTIHKSKGLEFPVVIYPFASADLQDVKKEHLWLPLPEGLNDIPIGYLKANKNMLDWGETEAFAYQKLLDTTEFDSINVLYVALTRASHQLYILSNLDINAKGEVNAKTVSGLFIEYLRSKNLWNDALSYDFGEKMIQNYKPSEAPSLLKQENFHSSFTQNNAVQLMTKSGALWDSVQGMAITNGNLFHDIFSEINTLEDLPIAFSKYATPEDLSTEQTNELENLITAVIKHPELQQYFASGETVIKERNILSPSGEVLRPDRLNFNGDKVTIIDYKTGAFQESHKHQMEQYEQVLKEMGYTTLKKILIYINTEVNIAFV